MSGTIGAPEVPIISRLFAIPDQARVKVKSFEPQYRTVSGIYPYPHQEYEFGHQDNTSEWVFDDKYYKEGQMFPEKWVTLSEPAIMRDFRVVPVNISPIRVNAITGEVQILTGLHLELEFDNGPTTNIKTHHFDKMVEGFANIYQNSIANFDWVNPNGESIKGTLLIVYPNVSNVQQTLAPLIEWKTRRGYNTIAVSVANNTTTSTVFNVINNAYLTADPPLEHVILIGDAAGSIDIPCYTWTSGWYNGATDHTYTMHEGNDILSDVFIGRYSVDNTNTLATAVSKVLYYESNPMLTSTDWYKRGFVVAGSSYSGLSTIQVSRSIRDYWLEDGYTQVDTIWYSMGGSISTFMTSQCNAGVGALNHRGYIGVNGFSTSSVYALQNAGKLPFACILTCGSGDYGSSGADLNEAWLRAGTPGYPTGGIAGIGTATSGTHTRFNNTMSLGVWYGIRYAGTYELGAAVARGKYELFLNYQTDVTNMSAFTYWNNMMGDPSTDLWTDVPQTLTVSHPISLPVGATSLTVTIADPSGNPLADRYVCLWKGTETYIGGRTDENGIFTHAIDVPTSGDLLVTITYHNDYPYLGTVAVEESAVNPSFYSLTLDDDNNGSSQGNDDGIANPSEILELDVQLKNYGTTTTATGISAALSTEDENVTVINAEQTYADITSGGMVYGDGEFVIELDADFPQGYMIPLILTVNSDQGEFISAFEIEVSSGESMITGAVFSNGVLEPGETDEMVVTIENIGEMDLTGVTAILRSADNQITITDSVGTFGNVNGGAQADNSADPFEVSADIWATYGRGTTFVIYITSDNGFEQELEFGGVLGTVSTADPLGPDSHGYYCIDNTDIAYSGCPSWDWVEVNPHVGGGLPGTHLYLPDFSNQQDVSALINLPFDFTFYGETFNQLTVCSNGWQAFGDETYHSDFRNYSIPSAFGANSGMLCPFWDNLVMGGGGVYYYYDEDNNRFIVEYYNVAHQSGGNECFQIILYDPAHYPTPTGDGEILFQYSTVTAVSGPGSDNPYFTTGIENHDHTDGLMYAYWNVYNPAAPILQYGRTLKFTTIEPLRQPITPTLEITLTPANPPIIIPPNGGSFDYEIEVENTGNEPNTFDFWNLILLPDSSIYGPTILRTTVNILGGALITRDMTQGVPGYASAGTYTYSAYVGNYNSNEIWDEDSFTFEKTGFDPEVTGEWWVAGWDEELGTLVTTLPERFELGTASPNPFNPTTEISYALPHADIVTLTVFNTLGQRVAVLQDGWMEAGWHQVQFDGAQLSSGIYFYALQAGSFVETKKMLLVK